LEKYTVYIFRAYISLKVYKKQQFKKRATFNLLSLFFMYSVGKNARERLRWKATLIWSKGGGNPGFSRGWRAPEVAKPPEGQSYGLSNP
jgi:hypothetical protein